MQEIGKMEHFFTFKDWRNNVYIVKAVKSRSFNPSCFLIKPVLIGYQDKHIIQYAKSLS